MKLYLIYIYIFLFLSANVTLCADTDLFTKKNNELFQKTFQTKKTSFKLNNTPEISFYSLFVRVLILLIIITLIFYIIKKILMKKNMVLYSNTKLFNILASFAVMPGKFIYLIELGNEILVLGVTEQNMNLITKITDKDSIDTIKLYRDMTLSEKSFDFTDYLKKIFNKTDNKEMKKIENEINKIKNEE